MVPMNLIKKRLKFSVTIGFFLKKGKFMCAKSFLKTKNIGHSSFKQEAGRPQKKCI